MPQLHLPHPASHTPVPALSNLAPAGALPDILADADIPAPGWELQKLTGKHRTVCALLAQGESNKRIAALTGFVPEYITMLLRQQVIKDCIRGYAEAADARLVALTNESVEAIADVLRTGGHKDKMIAARLQLEAVNRVGVGSRTQVTVNQKYVVHLPAKMADSQSWALAHQTLPRNAEEAGNMSHNADTHITIDVTPDRQQDHQQQ